MRDRDLPEVVDLTEYLPKEPLEGPVACGECESKDFNINIEGELAFIECACCGLVIGSSEFVANPEDA